MRVRRGMAVAALAFTCLGAGSPVAAGEGQVLEGLLEPSEVIEVASEVPGIIEAISVDRGDVVAAGQVLARLKSGVEQASVDLARARVEFGRRKSLRNDELYRKKLISIHEKDEIETEIQLSELELREAEERLSLRTVSSTVHGVVVERSKAPGEYVGDDSILTVARLDPLYVEVIAPAPLWRKIKRGMVGKVRPESPLEGEYAAKVTVVDRVIDAASGTFGVRLELANPNHKLPAGLKCKVVFPGG